MTLHDTGISNARNVDRYVFGEGKIARLGELVSPYRGNKDSQIIFLIDKFFEDKQVLLGDLPIERKDQLRFLATTDEPTTEGIDTLVKELKDSGGQNACAVIGIGGGICLDSAKAVSNLLRNGGRAATYQGWDLVPGPGIFKIGVPTISGTGAEATRTCVMTNKATGLKLGMNSDYTVFNQLLLDPNLTATVPRDQYFFTGMDAWIHCVEALSGSYRNPVGDAFSHQAINLCREVFSHGEMMSNSSRTKMMVASYLGGCAIATSYVGLVHPFSAGLSIVLGLHHCVANCIVMRAMEPFYPEAYSEFMSFVEKNGITLPSGICTGLSDEQFQTLYRATVVHEKPLTNALGNNFKDKLTADKVREIFERM
jgi:3-deoxy-alpha-D-manno-octulosonate 8-oxidase